MCACVYIHVCVCMCVLACLCACVYVCLCVLCACVFACIYVSVCAYVCMYACVCLNVYVHVFVCVYLHLYVHACKCMYVCMCMTYIHARACTQSHSTFRMAIFPASISTHLKMPMHVTCDSSMRFSERPSVCLVFVRGKTALVLTQRTEWLTPGRCLGISRGSTGTPRHETQNWEGVLCSLSLVHMCHSIVTPSCSLQGFVCLFCISFL